MPVEKEDSWRDRVPPNLPLGGDRVVLYFIAGLREP
jgi:hypothetical protein